MGKFSRSILAAVLCLLALGNATAAWAADGASSYYQAKVTALSDVPASGAAPTLEVRLLDGPDRGKTLAAGATGLNSASDIALPVYRIGDTVIVSPVATPGAPVSYAVIDHYRLPVATVLLAVVVALAVLIAGWRGLGSIAGLIISLAVLGGFVVPQIIHGANPYLVSLAGCFAIAPLGIYLAHGFSRRTSLALASSCLTLIMAAGLSALVVGAAHLSGIATEDASYLRQQLPGLSLQGILLGGIMIGVLGVLDDITVGQSAAVEELHRANPSLDWRELYRRAMRVGREHISSLINTLVLAYVGASLIFVVYITAVLNLPLWLSLNSELVMEEIIRSLIGSVTLILAVPVATLMAGYFLSHKVHAARKSG